MARGSRGLHEAGRRWPLRSVGWTSRPVPGPGSQLRPPLCVPLSTPPRLPALSLHCSPSFLSSVLLFSPPPRSLLPCSLCPPTLPLRPPFPSLYLFSPPSASLLLFFLLSGFLLGLSVCLSPGCACPHCLLLSLPACPRLFLARPRLSPCRPACLSPCFPGRQP